MNHYELSYCIFGQAPWGLVEGVQWWFKYNEHTKSVLLLVVVVLIFDTVVVCLHQVNVRFMND